MSQELQYTFSIQSHVSFREEDYIVSSCNAEAFQWVTQWPEWGDSVYNRFTFLSGDFFSGKTHLASIWQKYSDATFIDHEFILQKQYVDKKANYILENLELTQEFEVELFHFINYMMDSGKYLVITSRVAPTNIKFGLKDLESRLKAFSLLRIKEPDDELVTQVMIKYFSDHQISIGHEAVKFLKTRVERSYKELFSVLDLLNKESLGQQKKISINFIKDILQI